VSAAWIMSPEPGLADELFPPAVRTVCRPIDDRGDDLLPEELALVARAVPKRRREFATGRRAARELLASLGLPGGALLRNEDRTPVWPAGVVGSISHCDGLCVVAVARASDVGGIGVDVEPDLPLGPDLWPRICTATELATLVGPAPQDERGRVARLVFSAKEAFYKSVFPSLREVLGFHQVELQVDWRASRFEGRMDAALTDRLPGGRAPAGRFARRGGFVLTGATLCAPG